MTEVSTQPTATLPTLEAPSNTNTSLEQPTVVVARETRPLTTENNDTVITNNNTPLPEASATVHKQEWFVDDPATKLPVNGNYHSRNWAVSQNEDGVHAGMWWRPPKLVLTSFIFFDVVSTRTTAAYPTINKQRTCNCQEELHNGWRNCKVLWGHVTCYPL